MNESQNHDTIMDVAIRDCCVVKVGNKSNTTVMVERRAIEKPRPNDTKRREWSKF